MWRRPDLNANAVPTVTLPTRPTNIKIIRVRSADGGRFGVMPVDRPTVANAEITSNSDHVERVRRCAAG